MLKVSGQLFFKGAAGHKAKVAPTLQVKSRADEFVFSLVLGYHSVVMLYLQNYASCN